MKLKMIKIMTWRMTRFKWTHSPNDDCSIPEHNFQVKTAVGKFGKMKGVTRETVTLFVGNHIYRKRRGPLKNGSVVFRCNGCEGLQLYLSAIAKIENGKYQLIELPHSKDHVCWASGNQYQIQKAKQEIEQKSKEHPTKSLLSIYEEVRNSCTLEMDTNTKLLFLNEFPRYRDLAANLYKMRREIISADPKVMTDLRVDLDMFNYKKDEVVIKGDQILSNGRRIIMFSSNDHLDILARAKQVLGDGTFRVTPRLWTQTFIISAQVSGSVFVPVVFSLLPDKKRESYDTMFSLLKENLESRNLEMSALFFMSDFEIAIRDSFVSHNPGIEAKGCIFHF